MKSKPVFGSRPYGKRDAKFLFVAYFDPNGIETIPQNIQAWQSLSRHELVLMNLWPGHRGMLLPKGLQLDAFDGIIIHPTVSYSPQIVATLDSSLEHDLPAFDGVKVLMKQDEQVLAGRLAPLVRDKGFDIVLTCLSPAEQEKVYPRATVGDCVLIQVLTGYVSVDMREQPNPASRDIDLSYRGSIQPLEFGRLGYEKRGIGYDMAAALCRYPSIRFDISSRWEDRLSGGEWRGILNRSKTVLGVESGANLFDFDGEVARRSADFIAQNRGEDATSFQFYKRAHDEFLHRFEGNVEYAQISPRHFEAAAAGAAQLLYEGTYSGIFHPHAHIFPLRRDLGNLDEAVDFVKDEPRQRQVAERTFDEIIRNPAYWYENFVSIADDALDAKLKVKRPLLHRPHCPLPRPVAYMVVPHDPVLDPRIDWFASSLAKTHDVTIVGTYRYGEIGEGPSLETGSDGIRRIRVERTRHDGAWLPSAAQLRGQVSDGRALLAELVAYSAAPHEVLSERLGAEIAEPHELQRFRELSRHMVNTSSALIGALEQLGAPDLLVAADLDGLFAATIFGEENGCPVVYDAHEYWPFSLLDFQHWEIDFWQCIERQLCNKATICLAVSPQLARVMGDEYGREFLSLPNAASLKEAALDMDRVFVHRAQLRPLRVLYQGAFAPGRGLEEAIKAWTKVRSGAQLLLRGPDNPYRQRLIGLARSLGLEGRGLEFPEAVAEHQLIEVASDADVGLIPYHPAFFAHRYCCPNKLSQFAAAGLPMIASKTEFVGRMIVDNGIGFTVDIDSPEALASLVDSLSTRRPDLISMGRSARALFEETFNWDHLVAPILDKIRSLKARTPSSGPDLRWIEQPRPGTVTASDSDLPAPTLFGAKSWKRTVAEVNVANVESGASIAAKSPFHPEPNDAGFVLRNDDPNGYAAVLSGAPLPHFLEIDLGKARAVKKASFGWYSSDRYATDYKMLTRIDPGEPWKSAFYAAHNQAVETQHSFEPRWARFVRVEIHAFRGDPRLLMRTFRLIECSGTDKVREMPVKTNKVALSVQASVLTSTVRTKARRGWERWLRRVRWGPEV
jgi:glycosyltransferase involved in cell wall biosynthesis